MRLYNATVLKSGVAIKALPITTNGKTPPTFPSTKGEFEHITRAHLMSPVSLPSCPHSRRRRTIRGTAQGVRSLDGGREGGATRAVAHIPGPRTFLSRGLLYICCH